MVDGTKLQFAKKRHKTLCTSFDLFFKKLKANCRSYKFINN